MVKAFKAIVIIVLLGVSAFFAVTYYKTFIITEAEQPYGGNTVPILEKSTEDSSENETHTSVKTDTPKVEEITIPVFRTTLPRVASSSVSGVINNVGGYSVEKLAASYQLGNQTFAIVESNSDNCDLECANTNLAVAVFDAQGSLEKVHTLKSAYNESFLASSLYDDGLMLVAASGSCVSVYAVTYDFKVTRTSINATADSAIAYYTTYGIAVVLMSVNHFYYYLINGQLNISAELAFSTQNCTSIVELYKSGDYYLIANAQKSGKVFRFGPDGVRSIVDLPKVDSIVPTADGYLILTTGEKSTLSVYDHYFSLQKTITLPSVTKGTLINVGKGFLLLSYGADLQSVSYYLCRHYDIVSIDGVDYQGIEGVSDISVVDGYVYFAAQNRNGTIVYKYDVNAHNAQSVLRLDGAKDVEFYIRDNEMIVTYDSSECVGEYAQNFGSTDVWYKKIKIDQ